MGSTVSVGMFDAGCDEYARKVVDTALTMMRLRGWTQIQSYGCLPGYPDRVVFAAPGVERRAEVVFVQDARERFLDEQTYDAAARALLAEADASLALRVLVAGSVKPQPDHVRGAAPPEPCGLYGCQSVRRNKSTGATALQVQGASRRGWKDKAAARVYELNARWTSPSLELLPAAYLFAMEFPDAAPPFIAADVPDVLGRLGLRNKAQLPRVLPDDVIVVWLGAKIGDVVIYPPDATCPGFTARFVSTGAKPLRVE